MQLNIFSVSRFKPFSRVVSPLGSEYSLSRDSKFPSRREANINKLLREVSRDVLFITSFVLKYFCCVGNRGWTSHNKQYYVVWNNKNTLYIDEKLSVQVGFVLVTTGVKSLFCD